MGSLSPREPDGSRLLQLPAEIRNAIYELVAAPKAESGCCGSTPILFAYKAAEKTVNLHVSLTAVNRQLRDEYLPILHDQLGQMKQI